MHAHTHTYIYIYIKADDNNFLFFNSLISYPQKLFLIFLIFILIFNLFYIHFYNIYIFLYINSWP